MNPMQEQVAAWMKAFGQDVPDRPCRPTNDVLLFRKKLIDEEAVRETCDAIQKLLVCGGNDLTEVIDGLADSLVVIFGTFVALGIDSGHIFAEVMRSNWTKLWTSLEVDQLLPGYCKAVRVTSNGQRCYLVKRNDGKVIKSPSYSPANLLPIIEAQMKGRV